MAAAAILNFQVMLISPFWPVDSMVFELCTKFGSNICFSHWDQRTYASDVHLMTSHELTSGFDFWSRGHLRMAVMHLPKKFGADIFIQCGVIDILPKLKMAAAAILYLLGGAMGPPTKAYSWCVLPVKISSWSAHNFEVIRFWNFCRSGLKVLFAAPKSQFLGLLPPKFRGTSFRPPKGTSLRDFTSFELSRVKIHPRVWPERVPEKKRYK